MSVHYPSSTRETIKTNDSLHKLVEHAKSYTRAAQSSSHSPYSLWLVVVYTVVPFMGRFRIIFYALFETLEVVVLLKGKGEQ